MFDQAFSLALVTGTVIFSWLATGLVLHLAMKWGLVDIPNVRSSHVTPRARGGGIAFATAFGLAVCCAAWSGLLGHVQVAVLAGCLAVAAIGFADDIRSLPAGVRLVIHLAVSLWMIGWIYGGVAITMQGAVAGVVLVLVSTWFINLSNFMDGTDGLAASQALCVGAVCAAISFHEGDRNTGLIWLLFAGAVAGFLLWNWPPARIFMGDCGSGFIGAVFAAATLLGVHQHQGALWPPLIMMNVFLIDASFTLGRRMWRREKWYTPHRQHAYQVAARRWGHLSVVQFAVMINLCWLMPLALLSVKFRNAGPALFLFSSIPLLYLQSRLASLPEPSGRVVAFRADAQAVRHPPAA